MSSLNKVMLIGNVGQEPQVRYLDRGVALANFPLATTERGFYMQNGTQVPDRTEWHSIVLWRNLAEWSERNLKKGMKVYVEGKLQTRSWDKDGIRRSRTEIIADQVQILHRPEGSDSRPMEDELDEEPLVPQDNAQIEARDEQMAGANKNIEPTTTIEPTNSKAEDEDSDFIF